MKKLTLVFVVLLFFVGAFAQQRSFNLSQFSFEDTLGKKYNLDSLKGKVVFVDCWFPSCPPCRAEMPFSKTLQERLKASKMDSNIVFVTICFKQTTAEWKKALHELPMPNAIHLYSPASTYEIVLAGGNYPTYRIFNTVGVLDIYDAPRPSEKNKIDFILFAATQNIGIKEASILFETEVAKGLANNQFSPKSQIVIDFLKKTIN